MCCKNEKLDKAGRCCAMGAAIMLLVYLVGNFIAPKLVAYEPNCPVGAECGLPLTVWTVFSIVATVLAIVAIVLFIACWVLEAKKRGK